MTTTMTMTRKRHYPYTKATKNSQITHPTFLTMAAKENLTKKFLKMKQRYFTQQLYKHRYTTEHIQPLEMEHSNSVKLFESIPEYHMLKKGILPYLSKYIRLFYPKISTLKIECDEVDVGMVTTIVQLLLWMKVSSNYHY